MAAVSLKNVAKRYGATPVIHGIDLEIRDGEFVVFVGPSGCGKSTLLRMIAGLEEISAGELLLDGRRANDIAPAQRELAMVFQSYALYPHMTVFDNMAFALKLAGKGNDEIRAAVERAADALQIRPLLQRRPKELSGGQRQRVAIGRAIVRKPRLFLFDEPLSNLDASLRVQMRVELGRLHQELKTTMIYVTHDQVEAMTLGERIVVFNGGHIEQVGTPHQLYNEPANLFVAGFLGAPKMNLVAADALPGQAVDGTVTIGIRPEHVRLATGAGVPATVAHVEYLGDQTVLYAALAGTTVTLKLGPQTPALAAGSQVLLDLPAQHRLHFAADGKRLDRGAPAG
jgi:multiple sugar transport system ATP-binding protein